MKQSHDAARRRPRFLRGYGREAGTFRFSSTCWPYFLLPGATLALLSFLVLDGPVATSHDAMSDRFVAIARHLTDITTAPWILIATGLLFIVATVAMKRAETTGAKRRAMLVAWQALYVFATLALASSTVNVVKRLIGRARPELFDTVGDFHFRFGGWAYDYASFPSGHSTAAGATFAALGLLFPAFRPLFACLAIFFVFCRVAVGAHYPSDVSAGLFYGAWVAVVMACLFARYRLLFEIPEKGLPVRRRRLRPTTT
ncbi:phosphatase PAP2 family protein [Martelella endophytica]|uniref:phosphatase PAP2 family protein n=1 Tax=Martelella endophytica TaxID=1486262 RepID=UPI000697B4D6|nr:phosphatase PAP2 family protein [Martelella endophytica]